MSKLYATDVVKDKPIYKSVLKYPAALLLG
jgi:hypothetical protein